MSNIPLARQILADLLLRFGHDHLCPAARRDITRAIKLMKRERYCRRAPAKKHVIDRALRARIKRLARNPDITMFEIANIVGLRNSGRVSDVMHGKR